MLACTLIRAYLKELTQTGVTEQVAQQQWYRTHGELALEAMKVHRFSYNEKIFFLFLTLLKR
jgi:hypothetical protein